MTTHNLSLEEITTAGEKLYFEEYKDILEKEYMGQYAVFDVKNKKYTVDPDRLAAVLKAKKEFGDKLFYIIQIGSIQRQDTNYSAKKYAWNF